MAMISRRLFLRSAVGMTTASTSLAGYAFGVEPVWRLGVTRYAVTPPGWPQALSLKVAVIADIHACRPQMSPEHIRDIVTITNALAADIIVVLGDFNGGHRFVSGPVLPEEWGAELAALRAPLGVYAILGNHDFWHGPLPNMRGDDTLSIRAALKAANIRLLENDALRIVTPRGPFWLAGLGDQMVHHSARRIFTGIDDLPGTLKQVTDAAPVLMLAHEPYIFPKMPERVSLTLCGHTHGGQVFIPGIGTPAIRQAQNYVYGHVVETGRHMIISGGLGTSILPVRFLRPPEVVEVVLGSSDPQPRAS